MLLHRPKLQASTLNRVAYQNCTLDDVNLIDNRTKFVFNYDLKSICNEQNQSCEIPPVLAQENKRIG